MPILKLRNDHITFSSANEISEICKPLLKLGITSFNYVRTYEDGSQINLSNTPFWLKHFYDSEFYRIGAFEMHPSQYQSGFSLWPQLSGQKIFYDARTRFKIDHGITIIEKQLDSCEFFYFGADVNNPGIINYYLNHLDLLKRFILHFREKAHKIIRDANRNRIILPDHFTHQTAKNEIFSNMNDKLRKEFLNDVSLKKFRLIGELEGEVLTNKQINCLTSLIQGKTAKEAAKELNISYRTVEGHIEKLKIKFKCHSKSELLNKLIKSGLNILTGKCYVMN